MGVIRIIGLISFILVVGLALVAVVDVLFGEVLGRNNARKRRAHKRHARGTDGSDVNNEPDHCALIKRRTRRPSVGDRGDANKRST
jgi:hypothetical protein